MFSFLFFVYKKRYKGTIISERPLLLLWSSFFRKCHSASTLITTFSTTSSSQQLQDTLTTAYERHPPVEDFTVVVEPATRHLTYCSMLLFLSHKPSFCYSNNFCHNLFTFLCLKDVPPLINFSNVF